MEQQSSNRELGISKSGNQIESHFFVVDSHWMNVTRKFILHRSGAEFYLDFMNPGHVFSFQSVPFFTVVQSFLFRIAFDIVSVLVLYSSLFYSRYETSLTHFRIALFSHNMQTNAKLTMFS